MDHNDPALWCRNELREDSDCLLSIKECGNVLVSVVAPFGKDFGGFESAKTQGHIEEGHPKAGIVIHPIRQLAGS
jgi:hypothetical protein